jgi:hypothetical protein
MTIFGKSFSEYVSFSKLFLILIPLVGLLRLGLSLQGVPVETVRWFSMSVVGLIAVIYYAIRVHTSGFGSYKQLLVLFVLQSLVAQAVSVLAIVLTMITGVENVFSAPEFGGSQWFHVIAHLIFATPIGALMSWAFGSLILLITRKVSPTPQTA